MSRLVNGSTLLKIALLSPFDKTTHAARAASALPALALLVLVSAPLLVPVASAVFASSKGASRERTRP